MSTDEQVSFRVDPETKARFAKAVEAIHRPAAQVLRDFMREFSDHLVDAPANERPDAAIAATTHKIISISEELQNRRREAVNAARASVFLEGFTPSAAAEDRASRYVRGEFDMDDVVRNRNGTAPER